MEGKKSNILIIEPKGTEDFKARLDLLQLFIDNSTDLAAYINVAHKRLDQTDQKLYPNK